MVGLFFGARAWRSALRDIGVLRQGHLTHHDAHFSEASLMVVASTSLVGASWSGFAYRFDSDLVVIVFGLWSAGLVRLLLIDVDTHVLPRRIVVPSTLWGSMGLGATTAITGIGSIGAMAAGASISWMMLLILRWVSRGDLGGGDVSLGPLLGMFVGWGGIDRVLTFFVVAFVAGGVVVTVLYAVGRVGRRTHIAFGPFLIVGGLVGVLR